MKAWKTALRPLGIPLIGEGIAIFACLIPSHYFHDGTEMPVFLAAMSAIIAGVLLLTLLPRHNGHVDNRVSYVTVTLMWMVLAFFGMAPFLLCSVPILSSSVFSDYSCSFSDAFFESMSGLTSTGATIFSDVELLPPSLLLWRSMLEWIGGFGIIFLVLAVVPSLGINKYSLYTAEASGADNMGKTTVSMRGMVQHTLSVYAVLTLIFVVLLRFSGMSLWESVNLTFANISTGGFSIYSDSVARFTPLQQYLLAAAMFVGGVNFALLYNLMTLKWRKLSHKVDQLGLFVLIILISVFFVVIALHIHGGMMWNEAIRFGIVQTVSVITTTGSVVADTNLWWTPILFLFLVLSVCGGMAGSTSGGVKVMRVLILFRSVRNSLVKKLHPHAYAPVRLNEKPVSKDMINNVMVIFVVYSATLFSALLLFLVFGVSATEALGAAFGCLTSYGPGMGACGGFGSYAAFPVMAKWLCGVLMLLGRLECLTVFILFLPGFWRRR